MDYNRWREIVLEEGLTEAQADSLWEDKPERLDIEILSEEALRAVTRVLLPRFVAQRGVNNVG